MSKPPTRSGEHGSPRTAGTSPRTAGVELPYAADGDPDEPGGTHRILTLVENDGNRAVVGEWLGAHPQYERVAADPSDLGGVTFDLCLVDAGAFSRWWRALEDRRTADHPIPTPCLLFGRPLEVERFFSRSTAEQRSVVDDVVETPVSRSLLDRRTERLLHLRDQTIELEERRERLSLLTELVGHDITNAAAAVTGWGDLLRPHVEPEGMAALERVLSGGERIAELAALGRAVATTLDDERATTSRPVDLTRILREEAAAACATHEVSVGGLDDLPDELNVTGNETLSLVFGNLVANAIRHNDTGHPELRVAVETRPVAGTAVARVADNGPGVSDALKSRVFEREFKRSDSEGEGLGLYLVRRFVESLGGEIWFEDAAGGGAVACVALDLA